MTVKEISKTVNKTERSVRNWIEKVAEKSSVMAEKSSVMAEKSSASNSTHPADYTLDETIEIIETGLGKNAAAVFRANAENKIVSSEYVTRNEIAGIITAVMKEIIPLITNQKTVTNQIEFIQDYYSILGYCNIKKIKITFSDAIRFGKEAAKISRENDIEIRNVSDEHYGTVGSYHIDILKKVFAV
jgi:hypothetical protein